jgi:hypothetical protein
MSLIVDKKRSTLTVWTFKAGLLARLAHDLQIEVSEYHFVVHGDFRKEWSAELGIPVLGLGVLGAVKNKVLQAGKLSLDDRAEIEQTLRSEVLEADRFPLIHYRASFHGPENQENIHGELTLKGQTRPVHVSGRLEKTITGVHLQGRVKILQSDFGIKPFQAFLGALKVKDEVEATWDIYLTEPVETGSSDVEHPL